MAERRTLVEGLRPDRALEQDFVHAGKAQGAPAPAEAPAPALEEKRPAAPPPGLAPLTTRVRTDYAAALKRASLERQLSGTTPSTIQDILEEALGPWLRQHGYLD